MNKKSKGKVYEDILGITVGFLILYFIFKREWLLYAALSLGGLSLLSKYTARLISLAWFRLTSFIGNIVSALLLSLIFFVVLTPISVLYRFFNRNKLMTKNDVSLFKKRDHLFQKGDLKNPW